MPRIWQVALKFAPGSTASLPATTSPSTIADDFKLNTPLTVSFPLKLPSIKSIGSMKSLSKINELEHHHFPLVIEKLLQKDS